MVIKNIGDAQIGLAKVGVVTDKRQVYSESDHIHGPDTADTAIQQSVSEYTERPELEFLQGIAMNVRY